MANYELRFKESVAKDFRRIPRGDVKRILQRIDSLRTCPRPIGCEKLSFREKYRLRQGDYRIIYEIHGNECIIVVVSIGHRSIIYRVT